MMGSPAAKIPIGNFGSPVVTVSAVGVVPNLQGATPEYSINNKLAKIFYLECMANNGELPPGIKSADQSRCLVAFKWYVSYITKGVHLYTHPQGFD